MIEQLIKKLTNLYLVTKEMWLSYNTHAKLQEDFVEIQNYLQNSQEKCTSDCVDCPTKQAKK